MFKNFQIYFVYFAVLLLFVSTQCMFIKTYRVFVFYFNLFLLSVGIFVAWIGCLGTKPQFVTLRSSEIRVRLNGGSLYEFRLGNMS